MCNYSFSLQANIYFFIVQFMKNVKTGFEDKLKVALSFMLHKDCEWKKTKIELAFNVVHVNDLGLTLHANV